MPKILQIFQDRQDKKHELALVMAQKERELALAEKGFIAQARVEEIKTEQIAMETAAEERVALYQHDMEIGKGASQWIINLRASVRPVVTYIFVIELVALNIAGVWYAYSTGIPFVEAMENVFGDDEMIILSSIIAFWFGSQAFQKK
ncbi:MAG: hypothetical protein ACO3ON_02660 [Ilumatobacteraceae bacterium]